MERVTIDIVTQGPDGAFNLVLVEQGPWPDDLIGENLKRVEERLRQAVEVAVDGLLVEKFPDIVGKRVTIRLECYGTPRVETAALAEALARRVASSLEIEEALRTRRFVAELHVLYSWQSLIPGAPSRS